MLAIEKSTNFRIPEVRLREPAYLQLLLAHMWMHVQYISTAVHKLGSIAHV